MNSSFQFLTALLLTMWTSVGAYAGCLDESSPSCTSHPRGIYFVEISSGDPVGCLGRTLAANIDYQQGNVVRISLTPLEVSQIEQLNCATFVSNPGSGNGSTRTFSRFNDGYEATNFVTNEVYSNSDEQSDANLILGAPTQSLESKRAKARKPCAGYVCHGTCVGLRYPCED